MKILSLPGVAAGVFLLLLQTSGTSAAEINQVGIYADEAMSATTLEAQPGELLILYVVLANPYNPNRGGIKGEAVETVGCHSFTLDLAHNLELASDEGKYGRPICDGHCTDHRVCYGGLLPVGDDRIFTLQPLVVRYLGNGPAAIRLRPHPQSAFEDAMDYWYRDADQTGWMLPMFPASGSFDEPVFVVTAATVDISQSSWSALKSQYR